MYQTLENDYQKSQCFLIAALMNIYILCVLNGQEDIFVSFVI